MSTLTELDTQLRQVDRAISQLINGESITEMEIGSGAGKRRYKYGEVSIEALQLERNRLVMEMNNLSGAAQTFRTTSVMRTLYRKQ